MSGQRGGVPYVSTTCLRGVGYRETIERYRAAGIERVELGYCPERTVDLDAIATTADLDFIAHNYFRPVADEFVLNLASQDDGTRRRSVSYIQDSIDFCARHGIDLYTFHAGFRVDPDASLRFEAESVPAAEDCLQTFVDSLQAILPYAAERAVDVAIENNLIARRHVLDGEPVVLLADPGEFEALFDRIDVGVLLDTGHLSVAAETLGFDRERLVEAVKPYLRALHLHTNDGTEDGHEAVARDDWAFDVWSRFALPTSIETYLDDMSAIEAQLRTFES